MKIIIVSNSTRWLRRLIEIVQVKCLAQYLTQYQHSNNKYYPKPQPLADLMRKPSANYVNSNQWVENCQLSNSTAGLEILDVCTTDSAPGHLITICSPLLSTVRASWFEPSQNAREIENHSSILIYTPHPWTLFHQNIMVCVSKVQDKSFGHCYYSGLSANTFTSIRGNN